MMDLPIIVKSGNLPLNFRPTSAEFASAFLDRLRISIDDSRALIGSIGATTPTRNLGPRFYNDTWYAWDSASAQYVTAFLTSNYTINAAPTVDRYQQLPDKSGTLALMIDVIVPKETIVVTGTTPTINWSASNSFVGNLSGDTRVSFSNSTDAQKIIVTFINTGTHWRVTWPANVRWPNNLAPAQPSATGVNTAAGIYTFRRSDVGGTTVYFGESDAAAAPPRTISTGGTHSVVSGYGGFGGGRIVYEQ